MIRLLLPVLFLLSACGGIRDDLAETPDPIGDYRMGYAIAVAPEPQKGPFTRDVTEPEWQAAIQTALDDRFSRFSGDAFYHIGVAVEGYVVAQPGIPLVYTPKSVVIFSVNFFEDATQTRLNPEPIRVTVFEPCCGVPFLGSGLTKTKEEQVEGLAFNVARAVERTMRENAQWFGGTPEAQEADETIRSGNVLQDDPGAVAPEETPPAATDA